MPTNLLLHQQSYESFPDVLATTEGMRSPRMVTLDPASISPDANGKRYLKPGTILTRLPSGLGAPLKITRIVTGTAAAALSVQVQDASLFVPGDRLVTTACYAKLDLAGAWGNGDIATLTLNGQTFSYPVTGFTDLAALAITFATLLNNSPLGTYAGFSPDGEGIHVFGYDAVTIVAGETTAGDGTLTTNTNVLLVYTPFATVLSVNPESQVLTFTAPADRRLPPSTEIGVIPGEILGMSVAMIDLDETSNDVAAYTSCTVYGKRLPFWSTAIARALPEITLI
jgi:hypothetical protein